MTGIWVTQSVKRLPWAQVMISGSCDQALYWAPCAVEGVLHHLPLPAALPTCALSVK